MANTLLPPGTYKCEGTIIIDDHGKIITSTASLKISKGVHKGERLTFHENINKNIQKVNGQDIEIR